MNLAFKIAKRYIFSKKSTNAINIISGISMLGVFVGTLALIVVLSVFNGFEGLVISLYNSFDPQIKITASNGKYITDVEQKTATLKTINGIQFISDCSEEKALIKYKDKQLIITVKGVDENYFKSTPIDSILLEGSIAGTLKKSECILGAGVAYNLGYEYGDFMNPLTIYFPKREEGSILDLENSFNTEAFKAAAIFTVQKEIDDAYVLISKNRLNEMIGLQNECTQIEVSIKANKNEEVVLNSIKEKLGNNFIVQNRYQQHELIYKIMRSEKWAVFLILTFILIIATFNVIGSLTMLILEKKKDIEILLSLGASKGLIKKIFILEGSLITFIGALSGLIGGFTICYLQQNFGLIKLGNSGNFIVNSYPVQMQATDFVYVLITVFSIGLIAAYIPVSQLLKKK